MLYRNRPLKPGKGLRKSALRAKTEIRRKVRLAPVNAARKEKRMLLQYGPAGFGAWVRSLACVVPGCDRTDIQMAHVRSRGAGGGWQDVVPLCARHHLESHDAGVQTFEARYRLDLASIAAATALRWKAFAGPQVVEPEAGAPGF